LAAVLRGWLLIYHGVGSNGLNRKAGGMRYSAGIMILDTSDPRIIRYRSPEPVLYPEVPFEKCGSVADVVFPTAIDRRDDLGTPDRFDVYYGMADCRIGVARFDLGVLREIILATENERPTVSA
jgi:predicted GH43/DUF377 family glycosyl hydrolase